MSSFHTGLRDGFVRAVAPFMCHVPRIDGPGYTAVGCVHVHHHDGRDAAAFRNWGDLWVPNPSLADWRAETLRLSVFPVNPDDAIKTQHWQSLIATPPETVNRPPQTLQVSEEGPWKSARLQVVGQPGQVHWRTFSATPKREGPMEVGTFVSAVPPFRALMERWLAESCPSVNRIAFGATLLLPADSLQEVCRRIDGMLPSVAIDPDGTRDVMYRINRRRGSAHHAALQINRLATWAAVQAIGIQVAIGGTAPVAQTAKVENLCRLDLDINTNPYLLPQEALTAVFGELVDAAGEIAERGDIP